MSLSDSSSQFIQALTRLATVSPSGKGSELVDLRGIDEDVVEEMSQKSLKVVKGVSYRTRSFVTINRDGKVEVAVPQGVPSWVANKVRSHGQNTARGAAVATRLRDKLANRKAKA